LLDPNTFVRIHRSAIVNLDRVREMRPLFKGELVVVLQDGAQLKMSRGRREELESRFRRS
jgi:two-component system LytT family response regulator